MWDVGDARRQILLRLVGGLYVVFESPGALADLFALGDSVRCVLAGLLGLGDLRGEFVDLPLEFLNPGNGRPAALVSLDELV